MTWILIILTGMSIPASKHTRYITPVIPAISLVSSYLFVDSSTKGILFETKKTFLSACSFLPLLASLVTAGILFLGRYFGLTANFHYIIALALLTGLATFVIIKRKRLKAASEPDMAFTVIGVLAFIFLYIGVVEPVSVALESTRPFVVKMKSLQREGYDQIDFYKIGPDGEDINFTANYDCPIKPGFIKNSKDLLKQPSQICFITRQKSFDDLPKLVADKMHIEFYGKIGHKDFVVFTRRQR